MSIPIILKCQLGSALNQTGQRFVPRYPGTKFTSRNTLTARQMLVNMANTIRTTSFESLTINSG